MVSPDDQVNVKVGAEADVASGLSSAVSQLTASIDAMVAQLGKLGVASSSTKTKVVEDNTAIGLSYTRMKEQVVAASAGAQTAMGSLMGVSNKLVAALAGGALFAGAVHEMLALEDSVRGLKIVFGLASEEATLMAVHLKLAGISAEHYEGMAFKIARVLKSQSGEFDRLKIATKDSAGAFLPLNQILQNVYTRMLDFKIGTDQTEFALSTVGRSAKDFAKDMERLAATEQRAGELQKQLNIDMGPDRIAAIEKYRIEFNAFKVILEDVADKIGEAVLPRLMSLASFLTTEGPKAAEYIVIAVKSIITAFTFVGTVIGMVGEQIGRTIGAIVRHFQILSEGVVALANRDWPGVARAAKESLANMRSYVKESFDGSVDDASKAVDKIKRLWDDSATAASRFGMNDRGVGASGALPGKGTERFVPKGHGGGGHDTRMSEWRDELNDMNLSNGAFNQLSKENEELFWREKLEQVKGNGKEDVRLRQEINRIILSDRNVSAREEIALDNAKFEEMIAGAKKNQEAQSMYMNAWLALTKATYGEDSAEYEKILKRKMALDEEWAAKALRVAETEQKAEEDVRMHAIDMDRLMLDHRLKLRQVTQAQAYEQEVQLENRVYELQLEYLKKKQDAEKDDIEKSATNKKNIQDLELSHQKKLTEIDHAAEEERKADALAAASAVEGAFATFLEDIANHTKSLSQAFKDMANSIVKSLNKIAADAIAKQLFGAGGPGGGSGSNLGALIMSLFGGGGGGGGGGIGYGTAGGAIPIGPYPYAEGTPYVPRDMLAIVHKGEAVIPARYNNGNTGGRTFNFSAQFALTGPMDKRTQDQLFASYARSVQRSVSRIV